MSCWKARRCASLSGRMSAARLRRSFTSRPAFRCWERCHGSRSTRRWNPAPRPTSRFGSPAIPAAGRCCFRTGAMPARSMAYSTGFTAKRPSRPGKRRRTARPSASAAASPQCRSGCRGKYPSTAIFSRSGRQPKLEGDQPATVMWGHHPTFGSDLLAGEFEIQSGARSVTTDQEYDPPSNPLRPGVTAAWPMVPGKDRTIDLRRPLAGNPNTGMAALAYVYNFESPWISIRRLDNAVAATLSWDSSIFSSLWYWIELGGTSAAPWSGRARLIGLEPNTTRLAFGLAEAKRRGAGVLTLEVGSVHAAVIRLHVCKPLGAVHDIDLDGRARHSYE